MKSKEYKKGEESIKKIEYIFIKDRYIRSF